PFTLTSVCAFISMKNTSSNRYSLILSRLATGTLAFIAFTLRFNGILLLGAATVKEFLPNSIVTRWHQPNVITILLPYITFFFLYLTWGVFFPAGGEDYLQMMRNIFADTLIVNIFSYPISLFDFFTGGHYSAIAAMLLGPLVILGAVKNWHGTAHF